MPNTAFSRRHRIPSALTYAALTCVALMWLVASACSTRDADAPGATGEYSWTELPVQATSTRLLFEADNIVDQVHLIGDTALMLRYWMPRELPVLVSRTSGDSRPLGRRGGGPGELQTVGPIGAASRDSVLILPSRVYGAAAMLSLETGRGRSIAWHPTSFANYAALRARPTFRSADSLGSVYGFHESATTDDILAILRRRLHDGHMDTAAWLGLGEPDVLVPIAGGYANARAGRYQHKNEWIVTPDGRLVLFDVSRYGVTVIGPAGDTAAQWQVAWPAVPVNDSAWRADRVLRASMSGAVSNAVRSQLGTSMIPIATPDRPTPRASLPALRMDHHTAHAVDSLLWLPVHLVDPPREEHWECRHLTTGALLGRLRLPGPYRMLAVDARTAIVARRTEDGNDELLEVTLPVCAANATEASRP